MGSQFKVTLVDPEATSFISALGISSERADELLDHISAYFNKLAEEVGDSDEVKFSRLDLIAIASELPQNVNELIFSISGAERLLANRQQPDVSALLSRMFGGK